MLGGAQLKSCILSLLYLFFIILYYCIISCCMTPYQCVHIQLEQDFILMFSRSKASKQSWDQKVHSLSCFVSQDQSYAACSVFPPLSFFCSNATLPKTSLGRSLGQTIQKPAQIDDLFVYIQYPCHRIFYCCFRFFLSIFALIPIRVVLIAALG